MRYLNIIFVLLALFQTAGAQTITFEREGVEYRLELPSPRWRAVARLDVHDHFDFVNGDDRSDGYLRARKNFVEAGVTPKDLYLRDEWKLKLLPGYVGCGSCDGETFSGALSGAVFSYEYTSGGRRVAGRVYYLKVDARAYYTLHFTCAREKLAEVLPEADFIARSFRLRAVKTAER